MDVLEMSMPPNIEMPNSEGPWPRPKDELATVPKHSPIHMLMHALMPRPVPKDYQGIG